MVPIFSESAASVEKICGRGPVDRCQAAPAGAWSIRPAGSTQLKPGTISRPAGPCGTSAAENCEHRAETQARVIPLEAVCFALMTPTRHSSLNADRGAVFRGNRASEGGCNRSAAPSQAAGCKAFASAAGPHDDAVAVFEEAARLAGGEFNRPSPAGRDFEQAAEPAVHGRRDRAGAEQIAGAQVAAAAAVMRHELGHRPVEMARVADGQPLRGKRAFDLRPGVSKSTS